MDRIDAIALLESRLNTRLLFRSTVAEQQQPVGLLTITAPLMFGQLLLTKYEPAPIPVYLVFPPGRSRTAKQRAFVDFAAEPLRQALASAARALI